MLWEVDIHPRPGLPDRDAEQVVADAADLGLAGVRGVRSARGYLIESPSLNAEQVEQLAAELFTDAMEKPIQKILSVYPDRVREFEAAETMPVAAFDTNSTTSLELIVSKREDQTDG